MVWFCLKLSLFGALLWLDRSHAFQFMISRPIVAGPLVGLCLGNPLDGLIVGGMLELLWARNLPLGSSAPPDETMIALLLPAVGALGVDTGLESRHADLMYGFWIFLPAAYFNRRMDMKLRALNNRLNRAALRAVERGNPEKIGRYNLAGMIPAYFTTASVLFLCGLAGLSFFLYTFPLLPKPVLKALDLMVYVVPLLGVASALHNVKGIKNVLILTGSFALFVILLK